LGREREDQNLFDTGIGQQFAAPLGDVIRGGLRSGATTWVGCGSKVEGRGLPAALDGQLGHSPQDLAVAGVHAVEIADGEGAGPKSAGVSSRLR